MRQKIGMVFQLFNLFPHMCVIDNITLAPMLTSVCRSLGRRSGRWKLLDMVAMADKARPCRRSFRAARSSASPSPRAGAIAQDHAVRRDHVRARPELVEEVLNVMRKLAARPT